jgi:hypothetical protein
VRLGHGDGTLGYESDFGQPPSIYSWYVEAASLASADLNGDGHLDLVMSDPSGDVSTLEGHGDGTFGTRADFPLLWATSALAVGDVNRDGVPDVVTVNAQSLSIGELIGNGDGTLGQAVRILEDYITAMTAADLNGDGKSDVVTATQGPHNKSAIETCLGSDTGTILIHDYIPTTGWSGGVPVADMNGDGDPDVVQLQTIYGPPTVRVWPGQGDGTLGAAQTYSAAAGATGIALGDLNGDGHPDVVTANGTANTISVFLGSGDGTLGPHTEYGAGGAPTYIALADMNGDGAPDAVTVNLTAGGVTVLSGKGDGSFGAPASYPVPGAPPRLAIADLNADGWQDIVTANYDSAGTVSVLLGTGGGQFATHVEYRVGDKPACVAVADLDGDHLPDIVTINQAQSTASVLLGAGDGTFKPEGADYGVDEDAKFLALSDFDGDGHPDIVEASTQGLITILLNTGATTDARLPPEVQESLPFRLGAAWPNPTRDGCSIRFTLPGATRATMCVFDTRGRYVTTLLDGTATAGRHVLSWNGRDPEGQPVAQGVYLCELRALGRTLACRITVMR